MLVVLSRSPMIPSPPAPVRASVSSRVRSERVSCSRAPRREAFSERAERYCWPDILVVQCCDASEVILRTEKELM